jgi:hypothetical protein
MVCFLMLRLELSRKSEYGIMMFVVSAAATSPSTRVLGLVAAALMTKVKNEGLKTCVRNPRAIPKIDFNSILWLKLKTKARGHTGV